LTENPSFYTSLSVSPNLPPPTTGDV
jgi:hypothetical protein